MQDKIKEEFISTLSHEIRTPLTSIKGFSKTILDNWDKLDDTQKQKFIEIICAQSQRLINLVENVLNVSKIDSGSDSLVLKKINLLSVLNSALSVVKMNYKDFEFNLNCASDEYVLADLNKLQQVFINIFENAAKYSKNSKKIDVTVKNDKNCALISTKNYGVEIEPRYFEKVFEKFFRISSYLTSSAQGSGLGLYICKTLIEQMYGKIQVKSGSNPPYSEFIVSVPLYEVENATKCALGTKKK